MTAAVLYATSCGACDEQVSFSLTAGGWADAAGRSHCATPRQGCPGCDAGRPHPHYPICMACAVCRRPLNAYYADDTAPEVWVHSPAEVGMGLVNHQAVPVPAAQLWPDLRLLCDFCSGDAEGSWLVPVQGFVQLSTSSMSLGSKPNCRACNTCAGLIDRRQWRGLLIRCTDSFDRRFGPLSPEAKARAAVELARYHRRIKKCISGPTRLAELADVAGGLHLP